MAEIRASEKFACYFTNKYNKSPACYNFSQTDLHTNILKLTAGNGNLLIFYLHHLHDEFALNFCQFLQDPVIEMAFRNNQHILYCWDIESKDLKSELVWSVRKEIGDACVDYIERNMSVALVIKLEDKVPFILDVCDDGTDLIRLHDILTRELPKENVGEEVKSPREDGEQNEEVITALSYQKLMATYLGDRDYNSYESTEHDLLKSNIRFALYGPPTEDDGKKCDKDQQKEIDRLYLQILNQNETLPKDKEERAKRFLKNNEKYIPDGDFIPYPVFIVRKCKHHDDPARACRIVIDHEGRVYESWQEYLKDNRLPPCEMIYPKDGRYCCDKDAEYDRRLSPACDLSKKVAAVSDVTAGVTGVLAGGVTFAISTPAILAASPLIAVAAPIALPAAIAVGIGSGIYAVGRSVYSLVDRSKHKQDIDLSNSESRAAYLNIAGGVLSVGMFGAARTVSFLAGRGVQLGQGTKYMLYGINGISLTVNGIGIGNNIYEAYQARNASPLLIAQIGASILFFGNALYNFKAIGNIIEESQAKALSEIESSLRSNRHRRMFNKLLKESIRTQGESQGKASVIASIRNMENVDEIFATLTRSNKMLNSQGIRFSAESGKIHLNGVPVDMMSFGSMGKVNQLSFLETFPPIPENSTPNAQFLITQDVIVWLDGINIFRRLITKPTVEQLVNEIFRAFRPYVRNYIMDIAKRFFNRLDPAVANRLTAVITEATVKLVKWIVNQLMVKDVFKKILDHQKVSSAEIDDVVDDLEEEFRYQYVNYEYDAAKNVERKEKRRQNQKVKTKKLCTICSGYYHI